MIPAFVANVAGSNGVTTTFTTTIPTGTQPGDILYTAIAYRNTSTWSTNNSLGAWVQVHGSATGNSNTTPASGKGSLYSFYHIYNGISPNLTFTASANANVWRQITMAIRGINPTGGANTLGNTTLTVATAATVTPNTTAINIGSNSFLVMVIAGGCDNTVSGETAVGGNPATFTERSDNLSTSGGDTTLTTATGVGNTLGGSTGVLQATCTNSSFHVIGVAEFKPYIRSRQRYIAGS
jgi:hypothetical protein